MSTPIKWGTEFLVNTATAGSQFEPEITALAGGRFVVTWTDGSKSAGDTSESAVRAQMFNADGSRFGTEFVVNTATANSQNAPVVTALSDGGFAIAWVTLGGTDTSGTAISAQRYDANGSRVGGELLVNTTTAEHQDTPAVSALADGKFVVTWTDYSGVGDTFAPGIRAQMLDAAGSKFGVEFLVNSTTSGIQFSPDVATLTDGRFVVAWRDESMTGSDTSGSAIRARLFNAVGIPFGSDFVVNTTTQDYQHEPDVTALAGGRFLVTWTDSSQSGPDTSNAAVRAQIYNSDGSRSGSEFVVNTTTANSQDLPVAAGLPGGGFVIAWHHVTSGSEDDVRAQVYDSNGSKSGDEFIVNTENAGGQSQPTITVLPDGRFAIAFTDRSQKFGDQSGPAIAAQIFDPRVGRVSLSGTALDDQLVGTRFDDVLGGDGGNDWLRGEDGDDTLVGDPGADILDGGAGIDTVSYYDSQVGVIANLHGASLLGHAAGDTLLNIENVVGSVVRDIIIGDDNDNRLISLEGDDTLEGGGGNDMLAGGAGNDELIGGIGDDTAFFEQPLDRYSIRDLGNKIVVSGPDGIDTLTGIEHLLFTEGDDGKIDLNDGTALFDTIHYMIYNPDVYHAGVNALDHYNAFGWHEGRDPNSFFDTSGYLAVNKDVAAAGINPLEHYHNSGWHEGRDPSAWFDTTLYLLRNPDVAAAGIDPLEHYLAVGFSEGRVAHKAVGSSITGGFDAQYYLFHNPDVAAAGVDPLMHYNTWGWREGRNPNDWFDTAGYLAHYTDVAAAGINPLQHYETTGWKEGRDPSTHFDTLGYLANNPDVAAAQYNPLDHFLQHGIYEGRQAVNDGLWH